MNRTTLPAIIVATVFILNAAIIIFVLPKGSKASEQIYSANVTDKTDVDGYTKCIVTVNNQQYIIYQAHYSACKMPLHTRLNVTIDPYGDANIVK